MNKKQGIITFKVDEELMKIIKDIPNRSEFIRTAIMEALGSICPVCNGSGMLSKNQKQHWDDFAVHHSLETCRIAMNRLLFVTVVTRRILVLPWRFLDEILLFTILYIFPNYFIDLSSFSNLGGDTYKCFCKYSSSKILC